MSDLRRLAQPLLDDPPIEPTPVDELQRRSRKHRNHGLAFSAGVLVVLGALLIGLVVVRSDGRDSSTANTRPRVGGPAQVSTLEVGEATDVAIGSSGVWVPGLDVVRHVDPIINAVTATIPVPGSSDGRSVTIAFGSVWVTDTGTERVTRVDETTSQVLASIPVAGSPTTMAAAGGLLWVAVPDPNQPGGMIVPIDPTTNEAGTPLQILATEPAPFAQLTSVHDILFTAWGNRLMRIDPNTRAITSVPGFGAAADTKPVHVTNDGRDVFVLTAGGYIVELDSTGRMIRESKIPLPSAQAIAVAGGSVWVLTQPSSTAPSRLQQLEASSLRRVRRPIETGLTATGLAANANTAWVAAEGNLTRIDTRHQTSRPELCPGNTPWDRWGADALPAVEQANTDVPLAERELQTNRSALLNEYRGAVSVTVGVGYGRAWSRDTAGRVTVVVVRDFALIVHFRSKRDCPTRGTMPIGNATSDNFPVLLARDGDQSRPAAPARTRARTASTP